VLRVFLVYSLAFTLMMPSLLYLLHSSSRVLYIFQLAELLTLALTFDFHLCHIYIAICVCIYWGLLNCVTLLLLAANWAAAPPIIDLAQELPMGFELSIHRRYLKIFISIGLYQTTNGRETGK
jgi:hypothetical protein